MKKYLFTWSEELYLIHVQFDTTDLQTSNTNFTLTRQYEDGTYKEENGLITDNGFRFIVSRTCPEEISIEISYGDDITMKLYLIDDRAYYPTETYYEG